MSHEDGKIEMFTLSPDPFIIELGVESKHKEPMGIGPETTNSTLV